MVVGLTEYPRKRCADIFLCVIYSKVVHIYDYIHKAVYIIICALVRVFCLLRWQFTMPSLNLSLYHRDKKGESLLLQNQGQGRFSAYLIGNFPASSSISSRFDTILKYFLVFTLFLNRSMRGIHLVPVNASFSSA